jgi:hypothetical protein
VKRNVAVINDVFATANREAKTVPTWYQAENNCRPSLRDGSVFDTFANGKATVIDRLVSVAQAS